MEQNDEFIRIGTTYYKIVDQPLVNGDTVKRRIPWNIEALPCDRTTVRTILLTSRNSMDFVRFPIILIITERLEHSTTCMNESRTNWKQVRFLVSNR